MEIVFRTFVIELALFILSRITGKRILGEISIFDLVRPLIISDATHNALVGNAQSLATGLAVMIVLVMLDLSLLMLRRRFRSVEKLTGGVPVIVVENGRQIESRMRTAQVTPDDIL